MRNNKDKRPVPADDWRKTNPGWRYSPPERDKDGVLWLDACAMTVGVDPIDREKSK